MEFNIWHKQTYLQNRNRFTDVENRLVVAKWGSDEGEGLGVWDRQMQTIKYRMDKQQGPTCSTGNYSPYPMINHNEKI